MLVRGAGVRPRRAGCKGSPSSDRGGGEPSEVMSLPLLFPLLDFSSFSCPCRSYFLFVRTCFVGGGNFSWVYSSGRLKKNIATPPSPLLA